MPKVSVIMPLFNAEKYVQKAIDSILLQSFIDFELILIDDYSTDRTMDIVSNIHDPRIKIIKHDKNKGISAARNTGLDNCSGEYIALMDDDDLAAQNRLEKEVIYLDNHKDIDIVGGRFCIIDENDNIIKVMDEPLNNPYYIRVSLMFYDPIGNGSTMFRKKLIEQYKIRYRENCYGMEDYLFWIDCSLHGKITNLNEIFLYWRTGTDNESTRIKRNLLLLREKKFAELQKYAIVQNGYTLGEKEIKLLQKMYPEEKFNNIATKDEIHELYKVLRKLICQAEKMNVSYLEEIKIFCKKFFSLRLEYSEIWM